MTLHEWSAGFSGVLDVALIGILMAYVWGHRREITCCDLPVCTALALMVFFAGHTVRTFQIWLTLMRLPNTVTEADLAQMFPIVGSTAWLFATMFTLVGLMALMHIFGKAYLGWHWWAICVIVGVLLPFAF